MGQRRRPQPPSGEPVVVFEDVSIGFEGKPVLEGHLLQVRHGETRILLGPAGVGKSVLLKLTNGLLRPDAGRIMVFGKEISAMREEDLFEIRGRHRDGVSGRSPLRLAHRARQRGLPAAGRAHLRRRSTNRRVTEALRFVELEHTLTQFPSQLSGGMRRRVAIARAIVTHPRLILYDSPTGGLDPITSTTIIELVMKQRDVSHTSSIVVTHRLQDAFMLATHHFSPEKNHMVPLGEHQADPNTSFLMLHQGRLVFDGSTADLVNSE